MSFQTVRDDIQHEYDVWLLETAEHLCTPEGVEEALIWSEGTDELQSLCTALLKARTGRPTDGHFIRCKVGAITSKYFEYLKGEWTP